MFSFGDKKTNRATNRKIIKAKGNKLYLPGMNTTITCVGHKGRMEVRNCLPTVNFDNTSLNMMVQGNLIHWHPHLDHKYLKKHNYHILFVADRPLVDLDLDNIAPEIVKEKLKNSWIMDKFNPLITPSRHNGTHVVIWLDLSHVRQNTYCKNAAEGMEKYKESERYKEYQNILTTLINEIEQETGLKVDKRKNTIGGNATLHMTYFPDEISAINEHFKDKIPTFIRTEYFSHYAEEHNKSQLYLQTKKQLTPFFDEVERMLNSLTDFNFLKHMGSTIDDVFDWNVEHNEATSKKLYQKCLEKLKGNFEQFKENLITNYDKLWIFYGKKEKIGVHVLDDVRKFFGFNIPQYLVSYFRHILNYMLCLGKAEKYIRNKKTDVFDVIEKNEKFFFPIDFLKRFWFRKPINADNIAEMLGNGQTFNNMIKLCPYLVTKYGVLKAIELFCAGVDKSCANFKDRRKKQFKKFAAKIEARPFFKRFSLSTA